MPGREKRTVQPRIGAQLRVWPSEAQQGPADGAPVRWPSDRGESIASSNFGDPTDADRMGFALREARMGAW
jgi:hypothetical protein